jgi:hypothetical protein
MASRSAKSAKSSVSEGAIHLNRIERAPVRWVWKNWIPLRKLTVLDGDPGLGKSTLLLDIAARVSRNGLMPDSSQSCGPGAALLLTAEDGLEDTVKPRLEAANADLNRVICMRWVGEGLGQRPPALPDDLPILENLCLREDVRLVVIDPFVAFLSRSVEATSDQCIRRALHLLARMAEKCDCAVVVLRHLTKGSSSKAIYRGGGSIGIIGAARSGLLVAADPSFPERRVLALTESNLAARPRSLSFQLREIATGCCTIEWLGGSELEADDLLGCQAGEDSTSRKEAKAFLADFLQLGPRTYRDIKQAADTAGITKGTLQRAKRLLQVRSDRRRVGAGNLDCIWVWLLPGQSPDAPLADGPAPRPLPKPGSKPTWADVLGEKCQKIAHAEEKEQE